MSQRVGGTRERGRLKRAIGSVALGALGAISQSVLAADAPAGALARAQSRPNIVLILMDDLGYGDTGTFGSKINPTPNLDRLAREGMRLTSLYACPICSPSRAQILTGCYAQRVSIPRVLFPQNEFGLNPAENTMGKLLKEKGYSTMYVGKWHLGHHQPFLPTQYGFDHYFGIPYSNDMTPDVPKPRPEQLKYPPLPVYRDAQQVQILKQDEQKHFTEALTREAVQFIQSSKEQPFFLYLSHIAVHRPHHPGEAFAGRSGHGAYSDWVLESDWSVGQVMDAIRSEGLAENTLVIFTSDNGGAHPEASNAPFSGSKHTTMEGGIRVPTIAWWPGQVPAGSSCDALLSNFDFMPTFVALAGGNVPAEPKIDGKDIWPLLSGATTRSPHRSLANFLYHEVQGIRSGPWKLKLKKLAPAALYNLESDPSEQNDVSARHPQIVQQLMREAMAMHHELGSPQAPGVRPPGRL